MWDFVRPTEGSLWLLYGEQTIGGTTAETERPISMLLPYPGENLWCLRVDSKQWRRRSGQILDIF